MIQNIEAIRFGNTIFEALWNNRYIDNIQVTLAEKLGVEERAGYYDNSGALRDMVQNHIMQIVSLLAMEQPVAFKDTDIRAEKLRHCVVSVSTTLPKLQATSSVANTQLLAMAKNTVKKTVFQRIQILKPLLPVNYYLITTVGQAPRSTSEPVRSLPISSLVSMLSSRSRWLISSPSHKVEAHHLTPTF